MESRLDKTNDMEGMWSPLTSHMDWCEENYDISFYVAEFWNTVTNLCFIVNAIIGLIQVSKDKPERRHINLYLALLAVGLGSWGFHMTLRYTLQMADEIPMLWLAAVEIYGMWETNSPPRKTNFAMAFFLLMLTSAASIATLVFSEVLYFHITFGIYLVINLSMIVYSLLNKDCNCRYAQLAFMWLFMALCVWIIDRNYCAQLRSVRYTLPRPAQHLLQCHAWWHVFSNLACAFHILFIYDLRSRYLRHATKSKLKWGLFPYMEVVSIRKDVP